MKTAVTRFGHADHSDPAAAAFEPGPLLLSDPVPITMEDAVPVITSQSATAIEDVGDQYFDLIRLASDPDFDMLTLAGPPSVSLVRPDGTVGPLDQTAYRVQTGFFVLDTDFFHDLHYGDIAEIRVEFAVSDGELVSAPGTLTIDVYGDRDRFVGTSGADVLVGTAFVDDIRGLDGDDVLKGNYGGDTIAGGAGNDVLYGNPGDDLLVGQAGDDRLYGGQGNDVLYATSIGSPRSAGTDYLEGGVGNDDLWGSTDTTAGYAAAGGGVTVSLQLQGYDAARHQIYQDTGSAGADFLSGIANLVGSNFDDTLTGDVTANTIQGGGGGDTIVGADGNDRLFGNIGNDSIQGGDGDDYLHGGQGDDRVFGNVGNDELHGGAGDDYLNGGQGNDILFGEAGINALVGGLSADRFVMSLSGHDTIVDFNQAAGDKIDLSQIDAIAGNDAIDDSFIFSRGGVFTGVAGQLIVVETDTAHYVVEGDLNGDGHADYTLNVTTPSGAAPDHYAFIGLTDAITARAMPDDAALFG